MQSAGLRMAVSTLTRLEGRVSRAALKEILPNPGATAAHRGKRTPREALSAFIDFYVSKSHRDHPGEGCPIVALTPTAASVESVSCAFDAGVKNLVDEIGRWIAAVGLEDPEKTRGLGDFGDGRCGSLSRARSPTESSPMTLSAPQNIGIKAQLGLAA